jgi:hypothetical protein
MRGCPPRCPYLSFQHGGCPLVIHVFLSNTMTTRGCPPRRPCLSFQHGDDEGTARRRPSFVSSTMTTMRAVPLVALFPSSTTTTTRAVPLVVAPFPSSTTTTTRAVPLVVRLFPSCTTMMRGCPPRRLSPFNQRGGQRLSVPLIFFSIFI